MKISITHKQRKEPYTSRLLFTSPSKAREVKLGVRRSLLTALCNDDANGNVPLGKSCNRYWQCQGGYPRLQRCPAMLVFDRRSLRCVVPPTEDCDVPTTPPPTEGELSEGRNEQQDPEEENLPPGVPPLPAGALPIQLRARARN